MQACAGRTRPALRTTHCPTLGAFTAASRQRLATPTPAPSWSWSPTHKDGAGHGAPNEGIPLPTTTTSDHLSSPMQPDEWHEPNNTVTAMYYSPSRPHPRTLIIVTATGLALPCALHLAWQRGSPLPASVLPKLFSSKLPEHNTNQTKLSPAQILTKYVPPPSHDGRSPPVRPPSHVPAKARHARRRQHLLALPSSNMVIVNIRNCTLSTTHVVRMCIQPTGRQRSLCPSPKQGRGGWAPASRQREPCSTWHIQVTYNAASSNQQIHISNLSGGLYYLQRQELVLPILRTHHRSSRTEQRMKSQPARAWQPSRQASNTPQP